MKTARRVYSMLLMLYPHGYRKAFGAEMMQTFIDHYADVEKSEGRVSMTFWLWAMADEIKNVARQHAAPRTARDSFLRVTTTKLIMSALLLVPLYAVFYAVLVNVSLALPHPHVSGVGVVFTLAALCLLPGVLSGVCGYVIASAVVSVFTGRKAGTV